jgi:hypothetical protein
MGRLLWPVTVVALASVACNVLVFGDIERTDAPSTSAQTEQDAAASPPNTSSGGVVAPEPEPEPEPAPSEPIPGDVDAGPNPVSCASVNACLTAVDLGSISGDEGKDTREQTGASAKWFQIEVREDSSAIRDVKARITLESAPGLNFDLYTYTTNANDVQCTSVAKKSSNLTGNDSVTLEFGGNPTQENYMVAIEVRHVSGTCFPGSTWKLSIAGNP